MFTQVAFHFHVPKVSFFLDGRKSKSRNLPSLIFLHFFFKKSFPNAFDELRTVPQPQHCDKQLTFLTFFGSGEKVANTSLWELIYLESVELYIIVAVKLRTGLATGAQISASLLSCSANVSSTENFHFLQLHLV